MNQDIDPEQLTPDTAFQAASFKEYRGKPIKPFSAKRVIAAQSLGLRLWTMSDEDREKLSDSIFYSGIIADAVQVLYLCMCEEDDVLRAIRSPAAITAKALAWADAEEIRPGTDQYRDCMQIYIECVNEIFASTAEVKGSPDPKA